MGQALPEILARGAARQLYRLLRISAPLLRPIYQHIGLESRARAVTALVRIGWNGSAVTPALVKESEIVAPESLSPGVACIKHPASESGVSEALRATARALEAAGAARWGLPSLPAACAAVEVDEVHRLPFGEGDEALLALRDRPARDREIVVRLQARDRRAVLDQILAVEPR
jgi:hypothetical protein